jgi:murein DD-endopeptidase MepM/ murein hydrolase activator NlpD
MDMVMWMGGSPDFGNIRGRAVRRGTKTSGRTMRSTEGEDQNAVERTPRMLDSRFDRRRFLQMGAGAAAGALLLPVLPESARAAALVDPYGGSIPLVFPLAYGTYRSPVQDNWHANREGQTYAWNHRNGLSQRAHDGVDIYPSRRSKLPRVYAPLAGKVAAVCTRSSNTGGATVNYRVSSTTPPTWNYSRAIDDVINLPLYGNFVWLYSTASGSAGYFVFFCHLKNEATLQGLVPDQQVTTSTPVGVMGDTGNAAGTPQLHAEIHYPAGSTFTCSHCTPNKTLTSINPVASLKSATRRP